MNKQRISRLIAVLSVLAMFATGCGGSAADSYPESAITMMVPYREGGGTDRQARALAVELEAELGQPVNVINNAGAGGTVGAQELLASDPDGLTIMFSVSTAATINPIINDLAYSIDDFTLVAIASTFQAAIVTRADAPFDTWDEFVAYAKDNPGLKYASLGPETALAIDTIAAAEGLQIETVPAQGGADLAPLLFSGDVDIGFSGGLHVRFLEGDNPAELMKVLGNMGSSGPLQATPNVASMDELYGVATDVQGGLLVPADTPEDVVEKLANAMKLAVDSAGYTEVLDGLQFPKTYTGYPDAQAIWEAHADNFDG